MDNFEMTNVNKSGLTGYVLDNPRKPRPLHKDTNPQAAAVANRSTSAEAIHDVRKSQIGVTAKQ